MSTPEKFHKEWIESGDALSSLYIMENAVDYLTLLSKTPRPGQRPDGESNYGRCSLCDGPLLWGGTSGYVLHTVDHHVMVRHRLLRAVALLIRSKVAGRPLW